MTACAWPAVLRIRTGGCSGPRWWSDEAFRIAALQRLEAEGLLLEVAPVLDAELTEVLERRAGR